MIREEIPLKLYASARPGYDHGRNQPVSANVVEDWISEAQATGVKSILCLLDERHLCLYDSMPGGLLDAYRAKGFEVGHVPVVDHQWPSLSENELQRVALLFEQLPKPVLIHCSAGMLALALSIVIAGCFVTSLRRLNKCHKLLGNRSS